MHISRDPKVPHANGLSRITKVGVAVILVAALLASLGFAGTSHAPEVTDATGDVSAALVFPETRETELAELNADAFDVDRMYLADSGGRLRFVLEVVDLDGGIQDSIDALAEDEDADGAPTDDLSELGQGLPTSDGGEDHLSDAPTTPELLATYEMLFAIGDRDYVIVTNISGEIPEPGEAFHGFASSFTLHDIDDGERRWLANIDGAVDMQQDLLIAAAPLSLLGNPADGTEVKNIHAISFAFAVPMDFAPDLQVSNDPAAIADDPTRAAIKEYGESYTIGSSTGALQPDFTLSTFGATTQTAKTGEKANFILKLNNEATEDDVFTLTHSSAGDKWAITVQPTRASVDSNDNDFVTVQVTPRAGAPAQLDLTIRAASMGGDMVREANLKVVHEATTGSGTGSGNGASTGTGTADTGSGTGTDAGPDQSMTDEDGDPTDQEDTPGFGLVAVLGALGIVVVSLRRRR